MLKIKYGEFDAKLDYIYINNVYIGKLNNNEHYLYDHNPIAVDKHVLVSYKKLLKHGLFSVCNIDKYYRIQDKTIW
jgi:hypothetical protein